MSRLPVPLVARRLRYAGVLAVVAVIAYYSLVGTAQPPAPGLTDFWDKQLHFAAYAGLALALAYATADRTDRPFRRTLFVLGLALSYGLLMELVQAPLPERYFSLADVLANLFGALLALPWLLLERRLRYVPVSRRP